MFSSNGASVLRKLGKVLDDLGISCVELKEWSAPMRFGAHNLRKGEVITGFMKTWSAPAPPESFEGFLLVGFMANPV